MDQALDLVLVVGAGASAEFNLPVGGQLKTKIEGALRKRVGKQYSTPMTGDPDISECLERLSYQHGCTNPGHVHFELVEAANRVANAMPVSLSIDNFLDISSDDERAVLCGKLGIAQQLLQAESSSSLSALGGKGDRSTAFAGSWLTQFFMSLTENCKQADLADRINRVALVVFNYDRCIEHFMLHAFQAAYPMHSGEAAQLVKALKIYRPYGGLGDLPLLNNSSEAVAFGARLDSGALLRVAQQIHTFTEGVHIGTEIEPLRQAVSQCNRLAFLGFAFHPLNMEVLFGDGLATRAKPGAVQAVLGTALGLSRSDVELVTEQLVRATGCANVRLEPTLKAVELFGAYWRTLNLSRPRR